MHHELINPNYIPTAPLSVSIKATEQILKQLKNSIFEIKYNNISSTGFLCKIKIQRVVIHDLISSPTYVGEDFWFVRYIDCCYNVVEHLLIVNNFYANLDRGFNYARVK